MNVRSSIALAPACLSRCWARPTSPPPTRARSSPSRGIREESEQPLGKYSRFNDEARARLRRAQDVIVAILSEGKTLEQLRKDQQVDLMNAVEEVRAVLAENEKDKLECWRERKTGTNMKVTLESHPVRNGGTTRADQA